MSPRSQGGAASMVKLWEASASGPAHQGQPHLHSPAADLLAVHIPQCTLELTGSLGPSSGASSLSYAYGCQWISVSICADVALLDRQPSAGHCWR